MAKNNPFIDALRDYDDQLSALYVDIEKKRDMLNSLLDLIGTALNSCEESIEALERADHK